MLNPIIFKVPLTLYRLFLKELQFPPYLYLLTPQFLPASRCVRPADNLGEKNPQRGGRTDYEGPGLLRPAPGNLNSLQGLMTGQKPRRGHFTQDAEHSRLAEHGGPAAMEALRQHLEKHLELQTWENAKSLTLRYPFLSLTCMGFWRLPWHLDSLWRTQSHQPCQ